jgi:hypothetical protein
MDQRFYQRCGAFAVGLLTGVAAICSPAAAQEQRPNIVMLMTDDTGWNDFGT